QADHIIDIGPGAGTHGGHVIASGLPDDIMAATESLTGDYLAGRKSIPLPAKRTPADKRTLRLTGACGNNLQAVTLGIPVGLFTCVTGVSGSGKSTLINGTLYPLAATTLNKASTLTAEAHDAIEGLEHLDNCIDIDQ